MTFGEKIESWSRAMIRQGHEPKVDEIGDLDVFAYAKDHHNGPGCLKCGWSCCWHCASINDIPQCAEVA